MTSPAEQVSPTETPASDATGPAPQASQPFPPDEPFLVGRDDELKSLVAALRTAAANTTDGTVLAVTGAQGKAAVVRRAAHEVAELFPGGCYWITLGGPAKEDSATDAALSAFGLTPPADPAGKIAAYQSATARLQGLLVLEQPGGYEHVDSFRLRAAGSATVVITGVTIAQAAETVELRPLDRSAQIEILRYRGGAAAVGRNPFAVDRLLKLADGTPSLLRMFSEILGTGVPAADLADFAAAEIPAVEALDDEQPDPAIKALAESAPPQESRIFPYLAFIPEGRTFTSEFIASSLDESVTATDALLSRLSGANAIEPVAHGQFRLPRRTRVVALDLLDDSDDTEINPKIAKVWQGMLKGEAAPSVALYSRRRELAPLDADVAEGGTDLLNMQRDVDGLSYVLVSRDLTPPFSVGLFGDWGTGKTFFMDMMRRKISKLSADSAAAGRGHTLLCSSVRQVVFNAWHYIDANLWASLVTHILTELAKPEDTQSLTVQAKQENQTLLAELATSQALQGDAQNELDSIKSEREQLNDELSSNRKDRQGFIQKLRSVPLALDDLDDSGAEADLKESAEQLNVALGRSEDITELKAVASDLQGLGGQIRETKRLLQRTGKIRWYWIFALAVVAVIAGVLLATVAGNLTAGWLIAGASLIGAIADYAAKLKEPIKQVRGAVGAANGLLKLVDQLEPAKQRELELQISALDTREEQIYQQLNQAADRERQVERQIEDIQQGRSIYRYIEERATSGEYQKYLGLVSLVRNDFEKLSRLMEQSRLQEEEAAASGPVADSAAGKEGVGASSSGDKSLPRIDRVILYIDDLDRCPADRVVEVLEAVHLLLAFKLFVVVVGVDSRWLLRSLERHYAGQLAEPGDGSMLADEEAYWASTPQNYLEKIFQLPFSIRPMGRTGYESLVSKLLGSSAGTGAEGTGIENATREGLDRGPAQTSAAMRQAAGDSHGAQPDPPAPRDEPANGRRVPAPPAVATADAGAGGVAAADAGAVGPAGPDAPVDRPGQAAPSVTTAADRKAGRGTAGESSDLKPAALILQTAEVEYLKRLGQLVTTPRAAKRLINTYRLLKVSLSDPEYNRFAPAPDGANHYMIVQILLAILVGFPNQAWPLLRSVVESERTNWWDFWGDVMREYVPPPPGTSGQETAYPPGGPRPTQIPNGSEAWSHRPEEQFPGDQPSAPDNDRALQPPYRPPSQEPDQAPYDLASTDPAAREQARQSDEQWARLFEVFSDLEIGPDLPTSMAAFKYWAQKISRYSFYTGRLAALAEPDMSLL
jgi:hypothetical protein